MAAIGRYDALLCDLDGVLRIWNAAALAEAYGADVAAAAVDQWQDYRGAVDTHALAIVQAFAPAASRWCS